MDLGDALLSSMEMQQNSDRAAFATSDGTIISYGDVLRACHQLYRDVLCRAVVNEDAGRGRDASVRVGVMVHNSYEVMLLHLAAALRSPRARMVVRSGL